MNLTPCTDCTTATFDAIDGRCADCHTRHTHKCADHIHVLSAAHGECWICDRHLTGPFVRCGDCDQDRFKDDVSLTVSYPRCYDCLANEELQRNLAKPRWVVVVWRCVRTDGGPEEGGWSFEEGDRVLDADFHSEEAVLKVREGLDVEYPYTGKRNSVLGGEDHSVRIYDRWNEFDCTDADVFDCRLDVIDHYPLTRPYYS